MKSAPVHWDAFVVAESWIDGRVWEVLEEHIGDVLHEVGSIVLWRQPDVVSRQIARPHDVVKLIEVNATLKTQQLNNTFFPIREKWWRFLYTYLANFTQHSPVTSDWKYTYTSEYTRAQIRTRKIQHIYTRQPCLWTTGVWTGYLRCAGEGHTRRTCPSEQPAALPITRLRTSRTHQEWTYTCTRVHVSVPHILVHARTLCKSTAADDNTYYSIVRQSGIK